MDADPHPGVGLLARLLGTWRGEGEGVYPTIERFRYSEEVTFGHVGKPFLTYRQSTVNLVTGLPAHAEVGYWRPGADGRVELVLAHPTGITEVEHGPIEETEEGILIHLRSTAVAGTETAKSVTSIERRLRVTGDELRYDMGMAAVGQAHQHHLSATLRRA
jgi:hypothetical protein